MHLRTYPWKVVLAPDKRIREEGTPTRAVDEGTREMHEGFGGGGGGAPAGGALAQEPRPVDDGRDGPEGAD